MNAKFLLAGLFFVVSAAQAEQFTGTSQNIQSSKVAACKSALDDAKDRAQNAGGSMKRVVVNSQICECETIKADKQGDKQGMGTYYDHYKCIVEMDASFVDS